MADKVPRTHSLTWLPYASPPARTTTGKDDSSYELSPAQFHPIEWGMAVVGAHPVYESHQQNQGQECCLPHGESEKMLEVFQRLEITRGVVWFAFHFEPLM